VRLESSIEKKVRIELTKRKIKFEQEYPFRVGKRKWCYHIDFFIPKWNLAIECDGMYWHKDAKTKLRDARKDKRLNAANIAVVRITEEEIKKDVVKAVNRAVEGYTE
jgi:very-short-patch-repair endonuclease